MESGIQVPLTKKQESRTWHPESSARNPEFQTVLDSLQGMGEIQLVIRAGIEPGTYGWPAHSALLSLALSPGKYYSLPKQEVLRLINIALSVPSNQDGL